jgi:hypothetical protein
MAARASTVRALDAGAVLVGYVLATVAERRKLAS